MAAWGTRGPTWPGGRRPAWRDASGPGSPSATRAPRSGSRPTPRSDVMARHGGVGHPGTNVAGRAQAGVAGRFGTGFAFRDPSAEIRIPTHAEIGRDGAPWRRGAPGDQRGRAGAGRRGGTLRDRVRLPRPERRDPDPDPRRDRT